MTDQLQKIKTNTLHGVLLCIEHIGVLLTGEANTGKSSTALTLIDRGHALVADDIIIAQRMAHEIIGSCPESLQDLLKVRGVEIFNIRKLFGDRAISSALPIQLIIALDPKANISELEEEYGTQSILDTAIPRIVLSTLHSNMALVIESIVKTYLLRHQGYNAQYQFIQQVHTTIGASS